VFELLDESSFYRKVLSGEGNAVVLFLSGEEERDRPLEESLRKLHSLYGDKADFFLVKGKETDFWRDLGLFNLPALLCFRTGMEVERREGLSEESLREAVEGFVGRFP